MIITILKGLSPYLFPPRPNQKTTRKGGFLGFTSLQFRFAVHNKKDHFKVKQLQKVIEKN
jgi:hypothetical protein